MENAGENPRGDGHITAKRSNFVVIRKSSTRSQVKSRLINRPLTAALLLLAVLSVPLCASAFDSEKWHGKRQMLTHEAERLRKAYRWAEKKATSPAEGVVIPLEVHPDGSVKLVVSAEKAQMFVGSDLIWAENLEIKQFKPDGKIESVIKAKRCVFDRSDSARSGWVEGPAEITHGETLFKGRNVYFSSVEEYVMALEDSLAVSTGRKKISGVKTPAVGEVRLTSRRSDFDRKTGVIMFEDDAKARSDDYFIRADRMYAFLTGTNSLERIVAIGAVSITNENRSGACAMATYRRNAGEVEMFGGGKKPAVLSQDSSNSIAGRKIKFWIDEEQVEVDRPELTIENVNKREITP